VLWPFRGGVGGHLVLHLGLACLCPVVLVGLGRLAPRGLLLLCADELLLEPHNRPPAQHAQYAHTDTTQADEIGHIDQTG
jgi:hypothetical protein